MTTNRRPLAATLLVGGALALVFGIIAGTSSVPSANMMCGSVFSPVRAGGYGLDANLLNIWCDQARGGRAGLTWVLLILGAIAAVVGALMLARAIRRTPQTRQSLTAELANLATLLEAGTITSSEFEAAKALLLTGKPPTP